MRRRLENPFKQIHFRGVNFVDCRHFFFENNILPHSFTSNHSVLIVILTVMTFYSILLSFKCELFKIFSKQKIKSFFIDTFAPLGKDHLNCSIFFCFFNPLTIQLELSHLNSPMFPFSIVFIFFIRQDIKPSGKTENQAIFC
jgi:hypothetical protein